MILKEYSKECQIETDFEVLIPDYYISNITERLSLYKELDSIESESELIRFRDRLADRFGPIPSQTESLIRTIRLRWRAREIGFEKLVLRNQRLVCFFIANEESPYYQSAQFSKIIEFVQQYPDLCKMKEERKRLSLTFKDVPGIGKAIEKLNLIPV